MNKLTAEVLQKLKFWYVRDTRKTGQELADLCGTSERQVQSAIEELRNEPDENGVRHFILGGMGDDDRGYILTEDIDKMRAYQEKYERRAKTYFRNSRGMAAAIKDAMDRQKITGTLFEVPQ